MWEKWTSSLNSKEALPTKHKMANDSKYKSYVTAIDKALKSFEYTSEWADLVSALSKLQKVRLLLLLITLCLPFFLLLSRYLWATPATGTSLGGSLSVNDLHNACTHYFHRVFISRLWRLTIPSLRRSVRNVSSPSWPSTQMASFRCWLMRP